MFASSSNNLNFQSKGGGRNVTRNYNSGLVASSSEDLNFQRTRDGRNVTSDHNSGLVVDISFEEFEAAIK